MPPPLEIGESDPDGASSPRTLYLAVSQVPPVDLALPDQLPVVPRPRPTAGPLLCVPEDFESDFDLGETAVFPRPPDFRLAVVELDSAFERAILKVRTAEEIEALVPDFLLPLGNHNSLDSFHSSWNQAARIGRALRAVISAHRVLTGQFPKQAKSPSLPFRNEIYMCLRCIRSDEGWWTRSYNLFFIECIDNPFIEEGGVIQEYSVSHHFQH
eukprot:s103_g73.t1